MKSQFQTLSFLSNYTPKSSLDAEFIMAFLKDRFQITPKTPVFAPNSDGNPLDVQSFILWFESGLEVLKIARYKSRTVLLGNCTLEQCEIIGTLLDDKSIATDCLTVNVHEISDATEAEKKAFQFALVRSKLQPDPKTLRLIPKYFPKNGERVVFYDFAMETKGVGVAMHVDPDYNIMFFCYFLYPTKDRPGVVRYAFREWDGFNLLEYVFENIDTDNVQSSLGNTHACYYRLRKELEKHGKVWRDKLLRVEPINGQLSKGSKYYYISDKMEVRVDIEKGTPTSRQRWNAGNYFYSRHAADQMLGDWNECLFKYLASDVSSAEESDSGSKQGKTTDKTSDE